MVVGRHRGTIVTSYPVVVTETYFRFEHRRRAGSKATTRFRPPDTAQLECYPWPHLQSITRSQGLFFKRTRGRSCRTHGRLEAPLGGAWSCAYAPWSPLVALMSSKIKWGVALRDCQRVRPCAVFTIRCSRCMYTSMQQKNTRGGGPGTSCTTNT